MIIRRMQLDDKALWLPLWHAYLAFYKQDLSSEITDLTFTRCLDDAENLRLWVAYDGPDVVGFVSAIFHRSTWAKEGYLYLEDLYVDERHRGRGVARALINTVVEEGKARKADRLYWVTHDHNAKARALYDTLAVKTEFVLYQKPL